MTGGFWNERVLMVEIWIFNGNLTVFNVLRFVMFSEGPNSPINCKFEKNDQFKKSAPSKPPQIPAPDLI